MEDTRPVPKSLPKELTEDEAVEKIRRRTFLRANPTTIDINESPVGMVFTLYPTKRDTYYFSSCTGTYINNKEIITAAHCIPKAVRDGGPCTFIAFAHPKHNQLLHCESLRWFHPAYQESDTSRGLNYNALAPDIAILRMKEELLGVEGLELESNPSRLDTALSFHRYTVVKGEDAYVYSTSSCRLTGTTNEPHPYRRSSCQAIESNSGAPVLNAAKKIQGIVVSRHGVIMDLYCLTRDINGDYRWRDGCPAPGTLQ